MLCGISPAFARLFPTQGQITHALLTRAPLYSGEQAPLFAFDLHVLGTPPAFALSQDQTLQFELGETLLTRSCSLCVATDGHRAGTHYSVFKEQPSGRAIF
jgi:hypothetical protein